MPHIHEKVDFTASVFIVNGDAVLLRKHEKYNKWLQPGGHIELDEDPAQAAIREAKEETGLDITLIGECPFVPGSAEGQLRSVTMPRFLNRHIAQVSTGHEHVDHIYLGRSETRDVNPREEEKHCEIRWFTKEELDDSAYDLWPSTRYYARIALDELVS